MSCCFAVLIQPQAGGAEGIVNGMDVTEWNPKTDKYVPVKYDRNTVFEGKAAAKAALQAEAGLPVDPTAPVFGYIGRLEEQKGVDILLSVSSLLCCRQQG
jgi:granule-bound starch synthase